MTTFTAPPAPITAARHPRRTRAARAGLWSLQVLLGVQFAIGGVLKLTADPTMVDMFTDIGAGQGLRLLVGACEVAGAVGLLVPRLAALAATGLVALMVGATLTNVVVLQISPAVPLVLLVLATVVAVARLRKAGAR